MHQILRVYINNEKIMYIIMNILLFIYMVGYKDSKKKENTSKRLPKINMFMYLIIQVCYINRIMKDEC